MNGGEWRIAAGDSSHFLIYKQSGGNPKGDERRWEAEKGREFLEFLEYLQFINKRMPDNGRFPVTRLSPTIGVEHATDILKFFRLFINVIQILQVIGETDRLWERFLQRGVLK